MIKLIDILTENKILVPRRDKDERAKSKERIDQQKIQQYIKNGSKGDLNLTDSPITSLPDNLIKVGGGLDLDDSKIISLNNLKYVKVYLDLKNSQITSLPEDLQVEGWIDLAHTPFTKNYSKHPSNTAEEVEDRQEMRRMFPGIKGSIYLF